MNDFELKSALRRVPVPERTEEYWDDFPSRIRLQLRRSRTEMIPVRAGHPGWSLATGLALALVLVFVCVEFQPLPAASAAITRHERQFHTQLAKLDAGLHKLMFNPHGMGYLLAEAN